MRSLCPIPRSPASPASPQCTPDIAGRRPTARRFATYGHSRTRPAPERRRCLRARAPPVRSARRSPVPCVARTHAPVPCRPRTTPRAGRSAGRVRTSCAALATRIKDLLGTQPVHVQSPPMRSRSASNTRAPSRAANLAAIRPAGTRTDDHEVVVGSRHYACHSGVRGRTGPNRGSRLSATSARPVWRR